MRTEIHFFFQNINPNLKERRKIKEFIPIIFQKERKRFANLNIIFCRDAELLKINQAYLQHQDYTDIITFDLSSTKSIISGDIFISTERVAENSKLLGVSRQNELLRVIFHGILHLCGYNDKTHKDIEAMRKKENHYLNLYNRFT